MRLLQAGDIALELLLVAAAVILIPGVPRFEVVTSRMCDDGVLPVS